MLTDFEGLRVGEVFRSRKNRVFRIAYDDTICVAKVYPWANSKVASDEFDLLSRCFELGLRVPEPLELVGNTIVMTYLDGVNVADAFEPPPHDEAAQEAAEKIPFDELSEGLADWLASFHKALDLKVRRGDTILRNFIQHRGKIYGVDFEESRKGDILLDLGELCANILGMRPLFSSRNTMLTRAIISSYWEAIGRDRSDDLPEAIALGLEHYAKYRKDRKVLETLAQSFRNEGLTLLEKPKSES
jgi:tRNA A-37 threonylcarbamoyl transferase component Bud32